MVSTGVGELDQLLKDGYPDKSAILVVGPPGIGKEALGYWFTQAGLSQGDFCLYVTRLAVSEVIEDVKAFGVEIKGPTVWFARDGGQTKVDINDLSGLSFSIKETLKKNGERPARIVTDVLSSLLMLNSPETIYRFLSQLFSELKQYNTVVLATLEDRMHQPQVLAAMEQLFDGVVELRLYEEGLRIRPLLRILKMRGMPPLPGYFSFAFAHRKMEITAYAK
jgi:KaiC/GvpD/RAD55 family RecA-like ATPase